MLAEIASSRLPAVVLFHVINCRLCPSFGELWHTINTSYPGGAHTVVCKVQPSACEQHLATTEEHGGQPVFRAWSGLAWSNYNPGGKPEALVGWVKSTLEARQHYAVEVSPGAQASLAPAVGPSDGDASVETALLQWLESATPPFVEAFGRVRASEKVRVSYTPYGRGVFATRDIAEGEIIHVVRKGDAINMRDVLDRLFPYKSHEVMCRLLLGHKTAPATRPPPQVTVGEGARLFSRLLRVLRGEGTEGKRFAPWVATLPRLADMFAVLNLWSDEQLAWLQDDVLPPTVRPTKAQLETMLSALREEEWEPPLRLCTRVDRSTPSPAPCPHPYSRACPAERRFTVHTRSWPRDRTSLARGASVIRNGATCSHSWIWSIRTPCPGSPTTATFGCGHSRSSTGTRRDTSLKRRSRARCSVHRVRFARARSSS